MDEFQSAVAIVTCPMNAQILLGKAITDDDRNGKWCFPGGHIHPAESPIDAAIRECFEETGVHAIPAFAEQNIVYKIESKPYVAFVLCSADSDKEIIKCNHEFEDAKWFDLDQLPEEIYSANLEILNSLFPIVNINSFEDQINAVRNGVNVNKIIEGYVPLTYDQVRDIINYLKRNPSRWGSFPEVYNAISDYARRKWNIDLDYTNHLTPGQKATIDKFIPRTLYQ